MFLLFLNIHLYVDGPDEKEKVPIYLEFPNIFDGL